MIKYKTVKQFAAESGYSEAAIRTKIRDGKWRQGSVWRKAPDGRILISVEGYNDWVEMGAPDFHKVTVVTRSHAKPHERGSSPPPLI